jgi:hypothetical protein
MMMTAKTDCGACSVRLSEWSEIDNLPGAAPLKRKLKPQRDRKIKTASAPGFFLKNNMNIQPKRGQPPKDGVAATGHIQLRVTMARKNAYVQAAKPGKLTAWIFSKLDKEAGYDPSEQD